MGDSRDAVPGITPVLEVVVKEAAAGGRISCREAFRIAGEQGASIEEVGRVVQHLGLKIVHCQLGCF